MERKKFLPADAISRFWKDRSVTQDRPLIPPRPYFLNREFRSGMEFEGESIIRLSFLLSGILGIAKLIERHLS